MKIIHFFLFSHVVFYTTIQDIMSAIICRLREKEKERGGKEEKKI